jgi:hypothetical protein
MATLNIAICVIVVTFLKDTLYDQYIPHTYWCGSPMNGEYQHWLQPVALTGKIILKVPHAGRNRSMMARTSMCGECISLQVLSTQVTLVHPLLVHFAS